MTLLICNINKNWITVEQDAKNGDGQLRNEISVIKLSENLNPTKLKIQNEFKLNINNIKWN